MTRTEKLLTLLLILLLLLAAARIDGTVPLHLHT
jgi:hypothetical protein